MGKELKVKLVLQYFDFATFNLIHWVVFLNVEVES